MKFSNLTMQLLKNFANINSGIYFKEGNKLRTISTQQDILVDAEIDGVIPTDFGVYDLNNFLAVLSIHKDSSPNLEFENNNIIISSDDKRSKIRYRFCEPTMIVRPPEKDIIIKDAEMNFSLAENDLAWILKTASVLNCPQVSFKSDGEKLTINAVNTVDNSAHTNSLEIGDSDGKVFNIIFKTEKIQKVLLGDYDVIISSKGIAKFDNKSIILKYYLSTESGSEYKHE